MNAARTVRDKLSARLRELFATLRHSPADPTPASSAAATEPSKVAPPQHLPAGPEPASVEESTLDKPPASEGRQAAFFELPDPGPEKRILFVEDFLARFRDAMRRSGVTTRDPLHPVFTMLGEMLAHFSHLQVDQVTTSRQVTSQFVAKVAQEGTRAQELVGKETKAIAEALVHAIKRIEAVAAEARTERERVDRDFGSDLKMTLRSFAAACTWSAWSVAVAVCSVGLLATTVGGIWYGKSTEQQSMELNLRALKQPILEAAMRDGGQSAKFWLGVMEWNHFNSMHKNCSLQPFGSAKRLACTFAVWVEAPPDEPPSN